MSIQSKVSRLPANLLRSNSWQTELPKHVSLHFNYNQAVVIIVEVACGSKTGENLRKKTQSLSKQLQYFNVLQNILLPDVKAAAIAKATLWRPV